MTHRYFIELAVQVGRGSKCRKNKVGAVIKDKYNRVVSTGYNGSPKGTPNDCEDSHNVTYATTLHGELNAILFAKRDLNDCTLYCTLSPCLHCSASIIQAGIKSVYYLFDYRDSRGINFLREHGVQVKKCYYKDLLELKPNSLR